MDIFTVVWIYLMRWSEGERKTKSNAFVLAMYYQMAPGMLLTVEVGPEGFSLWLFAGMCVRF